LHTPYKDLCWTERYQIHELPFEKLKRIIDSHWDKHGIERLESGKPLGRAHLHCGLPGQSGFVALAIASAGEAKDTLGRGRFRPGGDYRVLTRNPQHKVFPYSLCELAINRSNQVWALDTTYIRMAPGFVYLTPVVDVHSRRILAHRVAITLEAVHAVDALQEAHSRFGTPDIVNTDQCSDGVAQEFVDAVLDKGAKLYMDARAPAGETGFFRADYRASTAGYNIRIGGLYVSRIRCGW
jgi:hypothetical protein